MTFFLLFITPHRSAIRQRDCILTTFPSIQSYITVFPSLIQVDWNKNRNFTVYANTIAFLERCINKLAVRLRRLKHLPVVLTREKTQRVLSLVIERALYSSRKKGRSRLVAMDCHKPFLLRHP